MLKRKRSVWSAVRKDAQAVTTGARRGALGARRGVKKDVSNYYPDAGRVRKEAVRPCPRGSLCCRYTPRHRQCLVLRNQWEEVMGLLSTLLGHASDLTPEQTREELDGILLPDEPVEVASKGRLPQRATIARADMVC